MIVCERKKERNIETKNEKENESVKDQQIHTPKQKPKKKKQFGNVVRELKTQYRDSNYSSSMGLRAVLSKASLVDKPDSVDNHIQVHCTSKHTKANKEKKQKARFDIGKKRKKKKAEGKERQYRWRKSPDCIA